MAYYANVNGSLATLSGYQHLLNAAAKAYAAGLTPVGVKIDAIIAQMRSEMDAAAIRSAAEADRLIVQYLDAGRVRPRRPHGHSGDLGAHVISRPQATTLPIGAFDVADIDELDRTINPDTPGYGTYWRSVEYGFNRGQASAKPIPGYFMPGYSRPDANQSRVHPYFEQMPYSRGMPALVVTNPQPAVKFLEKGTAAVVPFAMRQRAAIHNRAITALKTL